MRRRLAIGLPAVLIAVALIVALNVTPGRKKPPAEPAAPGGLEHAGGWPMFRGGPSLRGVASGALAESLKLLWRFSTKDPVRSSAAIDDGRVYIGSDAGRVHALELATGKELWSFGVDYEVEAAPLVLDGVVYAGNAEGVLFALKEGTIVWKYATGDKIMGGANWVRSPDGTEVWIIVGSYDFKLHCVNAATGAPIWTYETENFINGAPAIEAGRAVFGGCDAIIHVVSVANGSRLVGIDSGSYIAGSAALADGRAYVGNYDGLFLCVDVTGEDAAPVAGREAGNETGGGKASSTGPGPGPEPRGDTASPGGPPPSPRILWRYEGEDGFFSSPAVGETSVVVGCRDRKVHCMNRADGTKRWTFPTRGEVDSSPVLCGDKVVFGSGDGWLYVVRLEDGAKVWSYEIGEAVSAAAAVAGGVVVIGSEDGWVYAFGPAAP